MFKNVIKLSLIGILMLSLAACSGISLAGLTGSSNTTAQNQLAADSTQLDLSAKLGVGILKLEQTDLAITAEQASSLLPLWQAVKSISEDRNASSIEMDALYTQIQETLTPAQDQAIASMTWTQADLAALMQQNQAQIQAVQATPDASSASASASQSSAPSQGPGGGPMDGGAMLSGGPGGGIGDIALSGSTTSNSSSQVTQTDLLIQSSVASGTIRDLNTTFASAVIDLLQNILNA